MGQPTTSVEKGEEANFFISTLISCDVFPHSFLSQSPFWLLLVACA
jgi:hypothetical protein